MGFVSNPGARVTDRISELPDSLISHILSFLDTKQAVRTSVLSTRWEKQWTHVPILDIKCDGEDFPVEIDRVLFFRGSLDIQKLSLRIEEAKVDFVRLGNWICTAIWRNVVELVLVVEESDCLDRNMELPRSLFTCKTLKVLKLHSYFIVNPPATGCFPSLKILEVVIPAIYCDDNSVLEKLCTNCPVLEDLSINVFSHPSSACDINISCPQLKMLTISLDLPYYEEEMGVCSVFINAPKLMNFHLYMNDLSAFLFHVNANSHFKGNVDISRCAQISGVSALQVDHRNSILDAIFSVKHLSLSSFCVFKDLPYFHNLTHLKLKAPFDLKRWEYLIEFLKRSPNLEYLVIKPRADGNCGYFNPPEFVPVCMLSHLKTITLKVSTGRCYKNEMRVAKYLLKYCQVLNKMSIKNKNASKRPYAEKEALRLKVSMFEVVRGSEFQLFVLLSLYTVSYV